jgi:hypothetical protein
MKLPTYLKVTSTLAATAFALAGPLFAQTITVPNGDFSSPLNYGTQGAIVGSYANVQLGTGGPWRVSGDGILGVLLAPSATISSTNQNALFGGLLSANVVLDLVNNDARIYQNDLGASLPKFVTGTTYLLTADVTTNTPLSLGVLTNNGIGIGLLAASTLTASTTPAAGGIVSVGLLSGSTYKVSLTYTADAADNGKNIGVEGFVGRNPLVSISALGSATFDNFTLAVIPEPSAVALLGAAGAIGLLRRRR